MSLRDAILSGLALGGVKLRTHDAQADAILAAIRSYYSGHPERVSEDMITEARRGNPYDEVDLIMSDADFASVLAAALSKVE